MGSGNKEMGSGNRELEMGSGKGELVPAALRLSPGSPFEFIFKLLTAACAKADKY